MRYDIVKEADGQRRNDASSPAEAVCAAARGGSGHEAGLVSFVDHDVILARRLGAVLTSVGCEVRWYGDLHSFLRAAPPDVAGCAILDERLLCSEAALPTELPVILTSAQPDVATAVDAMKAGAVDYLPKPVGERRLIQAVDAALRIDRVRRASRLRTAELCGRFATLTRREREVMALVSAGQMNKQVAWQLGLSEVTVKVHRGSVMRKMNARSFAALVRMADAISEREEDQVAVTWPGHLDSDAAKNPTAMGWHGGAENAFRDRRMALREADDGYASQIASAA